MTTIETHPPKIPKTIHLLRTRDVGNKHWLTQIGRRVETAQENCSDLLPSTPSPNWSCRFTIIVSFHFVSTWFDEIAKQLSFNLSLRDVDYIRLGWLTLKLFASFQQNCSNTAYFLMFITYLLTYLLIYLLTRSLASIWQTVTSD